MKGIFPFEKQEILFKIPISMIIYNLIKGRDFKDYYGPLGFIALFFIFSNFGFFMSLEQTSQA